MSDQPPEDPTKRPMPWDPQQPTSNANPPEPPPDAAPTEVTPTPAAPQPDATPPGAPPLEPPAGEPTQPGLISAAPVGWAAPAASSGGLPPTPGPAGPGGPTVGWAPPPPAQEVPGAPGLSFADTTSRFVAYIIDAIILGIAGAIVGGLLGFGTTSVVETANGGVSYYSGVSGAGFTVPVVILSLLYFVFFWSGGRRATLGQRLFSLQVGNAFDGQALTLEQAVKRWVGLGFFIGLFELIPNLYGVASLVQFVWLLVLLVTTVTSPTKQGLHDRFANSAMVRPAGRGTGGLALACIVIVLILFALFVISIVALVLIGSQASTILEEIGNSI